MKISDSIKQFWSQWEECSKEEYLANEHDEENYTYIVDQDTNDVTYKKRKESF